MKKYLELDTELDKKIYDVQIGGTTFSIKSHQSEEVVQELVDMVNEKLKEAEALAKSGSFQGVAVLAMLNMAEEFMELKNHAKTKLDQIERQASQISLDLKSSQYLNPNS